MKRPAPAPLREDELPATVREISALIGREAALALVAAYGGLVFAVPRAKTPEGVARRESLIEVIGVEATNRLVVALGGEMIYIPKCADALLRLRDRAIVAAYDRGASVEALALEHRLSMRAVQKILKRTDASLASPQGCLF